MRIVFACVLALLLSGCLKHELQTGLNEHEAQEIIVLLKRNGLDATRQMVANGKESATWTGACCRRMACRAKR
jgi:type III secretory pathway lipoprotein EscJ